ncbi:PH domain-containing protein [Sinomonas mesophila]|uniref:PH domain-containing protein n=1 Tax=Sinomonas mesophila TaxID=1531955 RepID=UPI000986A7FD|nr:PH domain-containing protein [Sinomonas mesophila]
MHALSHTGRIESFTARSSRALAWLTWGMAGFGLAVTLTTAGLAGLRFAAPLALLAAGGWVLFWRPGVLVSDAGVELRNPFRSVGVPWDALAHVDTKYALTLITDHGRFTAWAAPAPGVWGARNARPEHLDGLPETTYGPARSVRPGDLRHTDSGQAAALVRTRWADALASGLAHAGRTRETPIAKRTAWPELVGTLVLAAATVVTLSVA